MSGSNHHKFVFSGPITYGAERRCVVIHALTADLQVQRHPADRIVIDAVRLAVEIDGDVATAPTSAVEPASRSHTRLRTPQRAPGWSAGLAGSREPTAIAIRWNDHIAGAVIAQLSQ